MSNESNSNNKPRSSRVIGIVLYQDNENHLKEIEQLRADPRAVGIYHDRDLTDEGEFKKPHYHFLYKFDNPSTFGSLLKIFPDHEEHLLYYVNSFKGQARYLLHMDNPEKAQYLQDDLIGNARLIKKYLNSDDKFADDLIKITRFIESFPDYLSLHDLLCFCYDFDCIGAYVKLQHTFIRQLDLHNYKFENKEKK